MHFLKSYYLKVFFVISSIPNYFYSEFTNQTDIQISTTESETIVFSESYCFSSTNTLNSPNILPGDEKPTFSKTSTEDISIKSNEFTSSDEFSIVTSETASNEELQTSVSKEMSLSKSYSLTFIKLRSVSFSFSCFTTNSLTVIYDDDKGINVTTSTIVNIDTNFPYIIHTYSPSYIETFLIFRNPQKKKISSEQIFGIACGCAAIIFLIIFIVVAIINKSVKSKFSTDFSIPNEDIKEPTPEPKDLEKETPIKINPPSDNDINFWI